MADSYLRKADENDADLLFRWVNDAEVRENALNPKQIEYSEHIEWFKEKLCSKDSVIYIYCEDDTPIGQTRVDAEGDRAIVSTSISNAYRFQGYGTKLYDILDEAIKRDFPDVKLLLGWIKETNTPSRRMVERHGWYEVAEKDGFIEYHKELN